MESFYPYAQCKEKVLLSIIFEEFDQIVMCRPERTAQYIVKYKSDICALQFLTVENICGDVRREFGRSKYQITVQKVPKNIL